MYNGLNFIGKVSSSTVGRLWFHLSIKRKWQFFALFLLMLASALAEVVTLGAVLPFLAILTDPSRAYGYSGVSTVVEIFGVTSAGQLASVLTIVFIACALVAGVIRILLLRFSTLLAFGSGADISRDIYRRTLYQPYSTHIARNSSEVISGITNKVASSVSILNQLIVLMSSSFLAVAITVALLLIDFRVATFACGGFALAYVGLSILTRSKLKENSRKIASSQTTVVKSLQEGLGSVRDILLSGTQEVYCSIFDRANQKLRYSIGSNIFLAGSPRFIMESLGMVSIALLAYVLSMRVEGVTAAIPTLGAMALGAQRLLPILQQLYNAWATIRGSKQSLIDTLVLLDQPETEPSDSQNLASPQFGESIKFRDVRFRYAPNGPWVLDGVNLEILRGDRVGIIGTTGSGKSTLIDIVMGLITPTEGRVQFDGKSLSPRELTAWQNSLAHVPQNVFLFDGTIAENIAFGVSGKDIDISRVTEAAKLAQISSFIENQNYGYESVVGERGVRLSGGQRQRIGIARALYKRCEVLILDEATSALDGVTEKSVMQAIQDLGGVGTIILIAHRLSTIKHCDKVFELDHGRIIPRGSYEQFIKLNPHFSRGAD